MPILQSITKPAATVTDPAKAGAMVHDAIAIAAEPHRGPVFLDFPLDVFGPSAGERAGRRPGTQPRRRARPRRRRPRSRARSPAPSGRRSSSAATSTGPARGPSWPPPSSTCACPCSPTASAAARCPPTTSWRSCARAALLKQQADLVVVLGTPLDFRLGFGRFGEADGRPRRRRRVAAGRPRRRAHGRRRHRRHAARPRRARRRLGSTTRRGSPSCAPPRTPPAADEAPLLAAADGPIKPTRVYGELRRRLARDAVVICDGGDFASYAGKYVEVFEPGCWLDTGPVRLPRQRAGLLDRRPGRPPRRPGRRAARRRRRRVQPDGRRLARAPRPARRDGRRQQRDVGPGEAPDAGDLRLGRGLRPAAGLPLRRGRARRSAAPARWSPTPTRSARRSTGRSPSGVPYVVNVVTDPVRRLPAVVQPRLTPKPRRTYLLVGRLLGMDDTAFSVSSSRRSSSSSPVTSTRPRSGSPTSTSRTAAGATPSPDERGAKPTPTSAGCRSTTPCAAR